MIELDVANYEYKVKAKNTQKFRVMSNHYQKICDELRIIAESKISKKFLKFGFIIPLNSFTKPEVSSFKF